MQEGGAAVVATLCGSVGHSGVGSAQKTVAVTITKLMTVCKKPKRAGKGFCLIAPSNSQK